MVTQTGDNPYAPPKAKPVETMPFHSSFEVYSEGILCHSGLVLPELDMVTGAPIVEEAVPVWFDLKAPSSLNRTVQKIAFLLLMLSMLIDSIIFGVIDFGLSMPPGYPGRMVTWLSLCAGLTSVSGITWALAQWLAPRVLIIGHITRKRNRWRAIVRYVALTWLILGALTADYLTTNIVRLSFFFGGVGLHMLVINPVLTRTIFAGMDLHACVFNEHQVLVTGLSNDLLEKLVSFAEKAADPA